MDSPYFFESTIYWSEGDERAHFEWLDRITAIKSVHGRGLRVFLEIDESQVNAEDIRELEAVYQRYAGDAAQLVALKDKISA